MKSLVLFFIFALSLFCSFNTWAATECQGSVQAPTLYCVNPRAGPDVRLSLNETQTCENGKILDVIQDVTAFLSDDVEIQTLSSQEITVKYENKRTQFPGDFSFKLAKKAAFQINKKSFNIEISKKIEMDYEGAPAEQWHFVGSFTQKNSVGKVTVGKLNCYIIR